jgi:probable biosynthetic protein (TIGR04098 family)
LVVVRNELDLGMPHLGSHALGESEMLKHLGHLRWQSFERLTGVPTRLVADHEGRRLYATFYHVDIEFPPSAPPHAFRENDRIVWVGDLAACGRNILDGHFALYRRGDRRAVSWGVPDAASRERFIQAGIPVVRLSNIFITQEAGPGQLRVGQPANADFSGIPELRQPPDGYERNRRARETGRFFGPPPGARPSPPIAVTVELPIDPDRDVNAAGLVYFGNFPAFFHVAERCALAALPMDGLPRAFADGRGTLRRRIGLFSNARADDRLRIRAECAVRPEPVEAGTPSCPYGLMWFTLRVERCSDGRLVAITTAERGTPLADPDDAERWRAYTRQVS